MATSLQDLFDQIGALTAAPHPDCAQADQAITALSHAARAMERLSDQFAEDGQLVTARRRLVLHEFATTCRRAAQLWLPAEGQLPDLVGVGADLLGRRSTQFGDDETWSAAAQLREAAQGCVELAMRFPPYAGAPALARASRVGALVARLATIDPPAPFFALPDMPVPRAAPLPADATSAQVVAESVAGLVDALRREARSNTLHLGAVLAASAAAESVARWGSRRATAGAASSQARSPDQAPTAWRVVQVALARLDDGSRFGSAPSSAVVRRALQLHRGVDNLMTARADDAHADPNEVATSTQFAVGQLPRIARQVEGAVHRWAGDGKLFARARSLPPSDRHVLAVVRDEVVMATPHDVAPMTTAARVAGRASAMLALELDRTIGPLGQRLQPQLVRTGHLARGADYAGPSAALRNVVSLSKPEPAR